MLGTRIAYRGVVIQGGEIMLVLTRTVGEELVIGDNIRVRVSEIRGGRIKLAIDAPKHISIKRQEMLVLEALADMAAQPTEAVH